MDKKRLVRVENGMLAGVCGGLAQYIGIDPTIIRLVWAIVTLFTGVALGIIIYIICAVVIPKDDGIID